MKSGKSLAEMTRPLTNLGAIICGAFVAFNIVIIFASVFMRYLFNKPILGTTEIVSLLMPFIAYFGIGYTASINGHIQMSALCSKYKGRHKYISEVIIYGLALIIFCLLVYVSAQNFFTSFSKNEKFTAVITLYAWIGKFAVPVGSAIMLIHLVCRFIDSLLAAIRYNPAAEETEQKKEAEGGEAS